MDMGRAVRTNRKIRGFADGRIFGFVNGPAGDMRAE
jgi:hypothetical protein